MANAELCFLSATALAEAIRTRQVSPVEVVDAHLSRIQALNGDLRSYLCVDGDRARDAAGAAEIEIGAGGYRGPLHGVPVAHKDVFDVQGLPTTAGSRL
ncbi:MAG: hypothetical protein HYU88_13525, partial [Chloroflexi bacterium]|nr:hypothetical protein [Chloroflexota bacterium]